jgi:DNA repair photolyase
LQEINTVKARVSFTLITIDDDLAAILEPGAPSPSRRLAAMEQLAAAGIETGVVMMPILPFIEDTPENILGVVEAAAAHSADYIVPAFGVSVREGQRDYFVRQLDLHFPGVRQRYEQTFGWQYQCPARNQEELARVFYDACNKLGLRTRVSTYSPKENTQQLSLF